MADTCILCGGRVSFPSGKKTLDGSLCKTCTDALPENINFKGLSRASLADIYDYMREQKKETYGVTASYGKLHLDELRGFLILADKLDGDGEPTGHYEAYCLADVKEIGLYPTNPKAVRGGVNCDVELSLILSSPKVALKTLVKQNAKCSYKPAKNNQLEWSEAGDLSMFRNMLNQAIKTSVQRKIKQKIPELTEEGVTLFQAESAFFLREGYTKEEVEDHGIRLLHAFQESNGKEDMKIYIDAVNYYYQILMKELGKKEGSNRV